MTLLRKEHAAAIGIASIALIIYIFTLCPTVNFIDSGELATDLYTLGIAHPTGYPLFTLIGHIASRIPLGLRVIYRLNLLSGFFCASALYFFFRFLYFFVTEFQYFRPKDSRRPEGRGTTETAIAPIVSAAVGTLVLGFSETYWLQALSIEVYSLHIFFLALLLFLFTRGLSFDVRRSREKSTAVGKNRYWFIFAFVLGLSFSNHGTTILLAPAFLSAYFYSYGLTSRVAWKNVLGLAFPFLLGFSIVLYMPLRASMDPIMNWGDPDTPEKFLWHVRGRQYTVWLFESWENASKQLKYFFDTLPGEFAFFPLAVAAVGVWKLFRLNKPMLVFTLLLFVGCIGYSINYDIHDIDSYFLLAYFTIALWCATGARTLLDALSAIIPARFAGSLFILACAVIPIYQWHEVDGSSAYLVEEYTRDMFRSVGTNGIVLSYQWDYFVSASYYLQLVENERPDIVVIDKELLRRSWYLDQLSHRYPWLLQHSAAELESYKKELYKFEHNLPYNPNLIEYHYAQFIHAVIETNAPARPVYMTQEIETKYTTGYYQVPSGLAFQLFADTAYHRTVIPDFHFRLPEKRDKYIAGVVSMYSRAYYNNCVYSLKYGKKEEAKVYIGKALELIPDFAEARALREQMEKE
ncbi:MAG TPA: DUF2723 domain-containing protein [Bacteroidota bacterium]|nr:DUF2723 domain-containing protein [Bacteroidota bacterium]